MEVPAIKHTNEALAFITLYNTMTSEIRKEVKEMITSETEDEETAMFTNLSLQSWDAENKDLDESKLWEKFYNKTKNVV